MSLPLELYMNNEIYKIDSKLTELRQRWITSSPAMKKYIEMGAKLLKDKRQKLVDKTAEKQENIF